MPTQDRREDQLVRLFLQEYEGGIWRSANLSHPDHEHDRGVDGLAVRYDGKTLAVEHTLIEFFVGERGDFVRFSPLLEIEKDVSLVMPGKIVYVDVPRGINQRGQDWSVTLRVLHQHLKERLSTFPLGRSIQTCPATARTPKIDLSVRIVEVPEDSHGRADADEDVRTIHS